MLLVGRRSVFLNLGAIAGTLAIFAFLPKTSSAFTINKRIRKLLADKQFDRAETLANNAVSIGIPLQPDVTRAIGTPFRFGRENQLGVPSWRNALVDLGAHRLISIHLPYLLIPLGNYRLSQGLDTQGMSIVGEDRAATEMFTDFDGKTGLQALLTYQSETSSDSLITGMTASSICKRVATTTTACSSDFSLPVFVDRGRNSRTIAVVQVTVRGLTQDLGQIIWEDVLFIDCKILLSQGWLQLANVQFQNCKFELGNSASKTVRDEIESGRVVSITVGK